MRTQQASSDTDSLFERIQSLDLLPPHDPDRYETTDGLDDPNCTNRMRANFSIASLEVFQKTCDMNDEIEVATGDLICDLLHLVHSLRSNPKDVLESALTNFLAEAGFKPVSPSAG
jgi:hypothetical protein